MQEEEYKRVTFKYGVLMLRTRRGLSLLDTLGKSKITKPLGWFMLYLMPVSVAIIFYELLRVLSVYLSPSGVTATNILREIGPSANLLLPGLNPYIPIVYGWIAIVVALVIHEASHGIIARSLGIRVKAAGLLFFLVIPIGAFVELDDNEVRQSKPRNSLRILAAGSGINFIVGMVCLFLLILSVSTMVPAVRGDAVFGIVASTPQLPSPASEHGIQPGDFIVALDGASITDLNYTLRGSGEYHPGQVVNITLWRNGNILTLNNVALGNITITYIYTNTVTNVTTTKTHSYPYLGVEALSYQALKDRVSAYVNYYNTNPLLYSLPPSFPSVGSATPSTTIPFSSLLIGFYNTPLGSATPVIDNLLFWLFFVNFNLAIFNSLPIYPMDGGQAFERFLVGVGRGRISDSLAMKVVVTVTLILAIVLLVIVVGPYLGLV